MLSSSRSIFFSSLFLSSFNLSFSSIITINLSKRNYFQVECINIQRSYSLIILLAKTYNYIPSPQKYLIPILWFLSTSTQGSDMRSVLKDDGGWTDKVICRARKLITDEITYKSNNLEELWGPCWYSLLSSSKSQTVGKLSKLCICIRVWSMVSRLKVKFLENIVYIAIDN